jgi:glycosyltransferase involved in cell wall biosynthesis
MKKLGLIVFCNNSGLGNQTHRLAEMIRPDRLLAIDSSGFSKNKKQNWNWYKGFSGYKVSGFPSNFEIKKFLKGLTDVMVCENPLNFFLLSEAKRLGIRVFIQSNFEFCDHLNKNIDLPTKFLMPSYWKVEEMKEKFGDDRVQYLPPPIDPNDFKNARDINFTRNGRKRFLHIIGTLAINDRNGTLDLLEAVKKSESDFELVIHSQHNLPDNYFINDHRIKYRIEDMANPEQLYKDFDALILPRRYGGLSLSTNEALMSGLPVIMPDISPNNELLPKEWLVPAKIKTKFMTRTMIDVYQTNIKMLAKKIDEFANKESLDNDKINAFDLGHSNFSPSVLRSKYQNL